MNSINFYKKFYSIVCTGLLLTLNSYAQTDSSYIPVRLSYFEAGTNAGITILNWKTACFLDFAKFDIQKSINGVAYTSIYSFTADRLRCEDPFNYTDNNNTEGRVLYRISVGDIDGKFYQSKIIAVFIQGKGFEVNSFAPTIVNSIATVSISAAVSGKIKLSVIDMRGTVVLQHSVSISKGASTHQFVLDGLQAGQYQALFESAQGEKNVIAFIKQ